MMQLKHLDQVNALIAERKGLQALLEDGDLRVSFTASIKGVPFYSLNDSTVIELCRPVLTGELRARLARNAAQLKVLGLEV